MQLALKHGHPRVAGEIIINGGTESLTQIEHRALVQRATQAGYKNIARLLKQVSVREKSSHETLGFFSQFLNLCGNTFRKLSSKNE